MKEKHIEESARAPEKSGHLNGELILMIFQELSKLELRLFGFF